MKKVSKEHISNELVKFVQTTILDSSITITADTPFKDIGMPMLSNAPYHATSEASLFVPLNSYRRLTNSSSGVSSGLNLRFETTAQTTNRASQDQIQFNTSN